MQREIKFRAWDRKDNFMYIPQGLNNPIQENDRFEYMQYTGLKDKNGREIFEGDIVKIVIKEDRNREEIMTVNFSKGCFMADGWYLDRYKYDSPTVIGNIYENPELLANKHA